MPTPIAEELAQEAANDAIPPALQAFIKEGDEAVRHTTRVAGARNRSIEVDF